MICITASINDHNTHRSTYKNTGQWNTEPTIQTANAVSMSLEVSTDTRDI
jgi:hypothetical protein